jgi:hypothetical protein
MALESKRHNEVRLGKPMWLSRQTHHEGFRSPILTLLCRIIRTCASEYERGDFFGLTCEEHQAKNNIVEWYSVLCDPVLCRQMSEIKWTRTVLVIARLRRSTRTWHLPMTLAVALDLIWLQRGQSWITPCAPLALIAQLQKLEETAPSNVSAQNSFSAVFLP